MELDARTAADGITLSADICIVGAGPVGLALADALQRSGMQVLLIESGGPLPDAETGALNAGATIGDPYDDLRLCRSRAVGGTAAIWNAAVHDMVGAKFLPMDEIDFSEREGIPRSGWCVDRSVLDPYYRQAQGVCGLGAFDYAADSWADRHHPALPLRDTGLTNGVYQFGAAGQFCTALPAALRVSSTVTLVHGATVTEFARAPDGERIGEARWTTLSGRRGVASAAYFVLAAGGIENARLLLLDAQRMKRRAAPWVGRGFMEHPIDSSLELISRAPALTVPRGFYTEHQQDSGLGLMGRIGLSPALLREERLTNASIRVIEDAELPLLGATTPRAMARRLVPVQAIRRTIGDAVRRVASARSRWRGRAYRLFIDLEQLPHRENRVVLSDTLDQLGQPQVALHWKWRAEDEANRLRIREVVTRELSRAGIGRVRVARQSRLNPNAHHHAGTTRMHPDPAEGVVEENLRVHGEQNLFVAGSSVFPTAGFANPTLTAIALALRLADHLAARP